MKVIFDMKDLITALDTVQSAAQTKVTSNMNNGYFFAARNGIVEIQANDFSVGIKTEIPATIEEEGFVVIAAPQLPSTIKMMPQGLVTMEQKQDETTVSFTNGTYNAKFPTRNSGDFPEVKEMEKVNTAVIPSKELISMISMVQFAAATDRANAIFTGILFEMEGPLLTMVATNTHRLACKETTLSREATEKGRIIVPSGVLSDVSRLLPSGEKDEVEISWASNHVSFSFGNTYFISTLINGEYPDWRRVIPSRFDAEVTLSLREFLEAVRFVSPISRGMDYQTINFYFNEGSLEIYEEDPTIGRSDTAIPAKIEGDNVKITFNCNYIEDILKHSRGETIILHLMKNGPMLVEQEEDKAYRYVVTPMRGH